jgi:signal transduction histidine kinase
MAHDSRADEIAREYVRARSELRRAAQVLHDEAGSALAVAGLHLQLLRMDHPEADEKSQSIAQALEAAMECVRVLSRELEPSPVRRTGLKNALLDLSEQLLDSHESSIAVRYSATATLPMEVADALYHAVAATLGALASVKKPAPIKVAVSGAQGVLIRISSAAKIPASALATAALLAGHGGLDFSIETEKGTIVLIRYAIRRPFGR